MSADKETVLYFIEPGNYSTQILTCESFGTSLSALSHVHTINYHMIFKQEQKQEHEREQQQQQRWQQKNMNKNKNDDDVINNDDNH